MAHVLIVDACVSGVVSLVVAFFTAKIVARGRMMPPPKM